MVDVTGSQNSNKAAVEPDLIISQLRCNIEMKFTNYSWNIFMTAVDIVFVQLYEPETVWKNNYPCLCFKSVHELQQQLRHVIVFTALEWEQHTNFWQYEQWRYPFCSFDLVHKKQRPRFRLSFGCASVCWSDIAPTRFIAVLTSGWHMTCWIEERSASHDLARFPLIQSAVRIEIKTSNTAFKNCVRFIQQNLH